MDQKQILMTLFGMQLVTYLPRLAPVWFLSSRTLPPLLADWLRFVPVAVLAAMLLPSLALVEGRVDLGLGNFFFWAALPTLAVAWKTRSLFAAVLTGMVLVAGARFLLAL
ncbi:MAG: AzlD domain-containing protein [Anaerolineae bacterium]|nr:AzlD domain-containing protein [Anaerolineae bacterium]